jgi:hypothetical protein
MENICKLCNIPHKSEKALHIHLKSHKISIAKYYQTMFPRYDRYDNSLILFKSKDFYFNSDFNSKENMNNWFKSVSPEKAKFYIQEWFLKRKEKKKLIYTLSQVELRSLPIPGICYISNIFGDYYKWAETLGFINRLNTFDKWDKPIILDGRRVIFVDTREKHLLTFEKVTPKIKTLKYGDYLFANNEWTGKIVIERKSLSDFIGTFSGGFERFNREIKKAKEDDAYVIVLVEDTLSHALDYKNLKLLNYNITIPPEAIFHNVREIIHSFNNIQFLFVEGHAIAGKMVEKLFSIGKDIKKYDLQLLKDKGLL